VGRGARRQLLVLALGCDLWGVTGRPQLLAALCAYLVALLIWQLVPLCAQLELLPVRQAIWLWLFLALPGVLFVYRARAQLVEREGLVGFVTHLRDRYRLADLPAIAPALLSSDRPQRFYVYAPDARAVQLRLNAGVRVLPAIGLGAGLFRIDYDPRVAGVPNAKSGPLSVTIDVDGRAHARQMQFVRPLAHPRWFCSDPSGKWAATPSEESDELIAIGADRTVQRLPVGDGPLDCAFLDENTVAVSHRFEPRVFVLDLNRVQVTRVLELSGALGRMTRSPDGSRLVIARSAPTPELLWYSLPELELVRSQPLTAAADQLVFGRDRDSLIVASRADATVRLLHCNADACRETQQLRLGRPAVALSRSQDGSRVYLATTDYRRDGSAQLGNHFVQDQLLTLDTNDLSLRERHLTARRSERQSKPGDVDQGISPLAMLELRDKSLAISFAGSEELWRLQPTAADPKITDLTPFELYAPHGLAELADGSLLVSSPLEAKIGVFPADAREPRILRFAADDDALLRQDAEAYARRLGERGFYESTRSGISCQSCHMHADSDDAAYNLGDRRLVPTLSVRGLLGTSPYLRDGSYPRLRDLDDVAQTLYRGYLRHQPGRAQLLETYIESLPRAQPQTGAVSSAERHGLQAFVKAHCDRCHAFPAFTNLGQLPMTLLFPQAAASFPEDETLDVPSLLSVGVSAPYLNDGRASNLLAVIEDYNPSDRHGDTRALNAQERHDLVAFLVSL
jgi:hypothetical protein